MNILCPRLSAIIKKGIEILIANGLPGNLIKKSLREYLELERMDLAQQEVRNSIDGGS